MKKQLKDKKITIYEMRLEDDGYGGQTEGYYPIHPGKLWAYVRQLSAKEQIERAAVKNTESMLFSVNWNPDITADLFIGYKENWYNITRVDTFEGYKDDLKLYASQEKKPSAGEIMG